MTCSEMAKILSIPTAIPGTPLLELKNITKVFPGVVALDSINLTVVKGEIHVLLGENGAGKSTAIKIITGVEKPDNGEIFWEGELLQINSVKDALDLGISVIFQELSSIPCLSVAENMFLGRSIQFKNIKGMINWREQIKQTREALKIVGADFDPLITVEKLSMGQRQLLEIAKAVHQNSKLIILDEPTSSLSRSEIDHLLEIMKRLKQKGVSMIFITHKLDEAKKVGDVVTVFKDGKKVGHRKMDSMTEDEITTMMVGREITNKYPKKVSKLIGKVILSLENIESYGLFKNISFNVKEGEIIGVFGLVGAGRTEVAKTIVGALPLDHGKILVDGIEVKISTPQHAAKLGIVYLSENRKEEGLILIHDVVENTTLQTLNKFCNKVGFLKQKKRIDSTMNVVREVNLRPMQLRKLAMDFSGGNQQKIVIAKCLLTGAKLFIFDEPTRGVDVGAKIEIYNIMAKLAESGAGIIMISSEMQEILGMSNRIITMYEGRLTREIENSDNLTEETLLIITTGG